MPMINVISNNFRFWENNAKNFTK